MTLHVNDGGTWKAATPYVKDGGTWKPIQALYVRDAGVWKSVYTAVSVTLAPGNQTQSYSTTAYNFPGQTITVTGGTASSYAWTVTVTSEFGNWTIQSGQGTATAVARVSGLSSGLSSTATLQCTVTVNGQQYVLSCQLIANRT